MEKLREKTNKTVFDQKAYSLVEVLVAVSIFSIAISIPTGLFISSLRNQSRVLASREIIDTSSHVIEYISRSLRMAKKDDRDGVNCINNIYGDKLNYYVSDLGQKIEFRNHNDECQSFYLDSVNKIMKETKCKEADGCVTLNLTPDDLEIINFSFQISGESQDDDLQPRLTINFEVVKKGIADSPRAIIQTTVSQRNVDITY